MCLQYGVWCGCMHLLEICVCAAQAFVTLARVCMNHMLKLLTLRKLDWHLRDWGGLALQSQAWVGVWCVGCETQSAEADGVCHSGMIVVQRRSHCMVWHMGSVASVYGQLLCNLVQCQTAAQDEGSLVYVCT